MFFQVRPRSGRILVKAGVPWPMLARATLPMLRKGFPRLIDRPLRAFHPAAIPLEGRILLVRVGRSCVAIILAGPLAGSSRVSARHGPGCAAVRIDVALAAIPNGGWCFGWVGACTLGGCLYVGWVGVSVLWVIAFIPGVCARGVKQPYEVVVGPCAPLGIPDAYDSAGKPASNGEPKLSEKNSRPLRDSRFVRQIYRERSSRGGRAIELCCLLEDPARSNRVAKGDCRSRRGIWCADDLLQSRWSRPGAVALDSGSGSLAN